MNKIVDFMGAFSDFMWGIPIAGLIAVVAIIITFYTKGFQFRFFGKIIKNTLGNLKDKGSGETGTSPWRAACTSIANTIGTGNIVGVAVAIGVGGPGAVFWMWMVALFGMIIKYAEVVLAVRYREPDALTGNYVSGMNIIAKNGLGKNWRWLAHAFAFSCMISMCVGLGIHTNGFTDAITSAFEVSPVVIGIIIVIITALLAFGGWKRISGFCELCVPVMTIIYIVAGILVLAFHIEAVPGSLGLIFKAAFTGQAAVGGFAGATLFAAFSNGMARGVYSSAAGQGLSPFTHANADTEHPAKQGIWAITEVFIDTIVVCTFTALVILCTGEWETGAAGSALVTAAFSSGLGISHELSAIFVAVILLLFGFSSMITDVYNGETTLAAYFNTKSSRVIFKIIALVFCYFGCVGGLESAYVLNDFFMAWMCLFTVLIILLCRKELIKLTNEYVDKYIRKNK